MLKKRKCSVSTNLADVNERVYCSEHIESVQSILIPSPQKKHFCDVTLIAETNNDHIRIQANRAILSASSAYFAAMFSGSMRESRQNEIVIKDVDGDALAVLIQFCMTGHLDLSVQNIEDTLAVASFLQLSIAVEMCCNFMVNRLDFSNCLSFGIFAEIHSFNEIAQLSKTYAIENVTKVCKSEEFLYLTAEELADLIISDDLNVFSEEEVFLALAAWYNHDQDAREDCMPNLICLIRLSQLELEFITASVQPLLKSNNYQAIITEAIKWHLNPSSRHDVFSFSTQPRKSTMHLISFVEECEYGGVHVQGFDLNFKNSTFLTNSLYRKQPSSLTKVVVLDNCFIHFGPSGRNTLNSIYEENMKTKTWTELPSMNSSRGVTFGAIVLNGLLYVIGGFKEGYENGSLNTAERYDPTTRGWSVIPSMHTARLNMGVATLNGLIYVAGGHIGPSNTDAVECFNPNLNQWTRCAPMNTCRSALSIGVLNGSLYAIGGIVESRSVSQVERYDTKLDVWTTIASLLTPREFITVLTLNSTLYAIGGHTLYRDTLDIGSSYTNITEKFDADQSRWVALDPINISLLKARSTHIVVVDNKMLTRDDQ